MDEAFKRLLETLPPDKAPELEERADLIRHKLKFIENKPSVGFFSSDEPLKISGGWVADAISIAGGRPLPKQSGISWEEIHLINPDIIILGLEGLSIEESLRRLGALLQAPAFMGLTAVKTNRLYLVDAAKYFTPSSSTLIEALEILAEIINPKQFIFGYERSGWAKFSL